MLFSAKPPVFSRIQVRQYAQCRDWHHLREVFFTCEEDGTLDIIALGRMLGIEGRCRVGIFLQFNYITEKVGRLPGD